MKKKHNIPKSYEYCEPQSRRSECSFKFFSRQNSNRQFNYLIKLKTRKKTYKTFVNMVQMSLRSDNCSYNVIKTKSRYKNRKKKLKFIFKKTVVEDGNSIFAVATKTGRTMGS